MATPPSSTDPTAATTTTAATSTTSEGPVLTLLTKRIRALRKKLNRISQMELSLSQGKSLNTEQQDVLRSKPAVLSAIDELEKLRSPLSSALDEELSLALSHSVKAEEPATAQAPSPVVEDLVRLMYFGSLFDVKQQSEFTSLMLTRTHERGCCLTYDYVTDDANDDDMLGEKDLDLISDLREMMIARPVNSSLSHRNAVERCLEHAKLWIENSDQPVHPDSNVTYAALREKLNKIMSSDYFTATPQMKGPGEVAAAAAVANFGSFQVPIHDSMVNVQAPVQEEVTPEQYQAEVTPEQYQDTQENAVNYEVQSHQENAAHYEEPEITEHQQSGNPEEFHKDEKNTENPAEVISAQTDQEQYQNEEGEHEHGYRNVDYRDQQYIPRRGQRGGSRGGGRRGFFNGRGGSRGGGGGGGGGAPRGNGPYQNGRNQYQDNYYPRNYNRRGRGGPAAGAGAGAGGNGGGYYNNSSGGGQGNHPRAADIGVAS